MNVVSPEWGERIFRATAAFCRRSAAAIYDPASLPPLTRGATLCRHFVAKEKGERALGSALCKHDLARGRDDHHRGHCH
jgi:hypothetical protein